MKGQSLNPSSIPFIASNKDEKTICDICITLHDDSISNNASDIIIPPTKDDFRGCKNFLRGATQSFIQNNIKRWTAELLTKEQWAESDLQHVLMLLINIKLD